MAMNAGGSAPKKTAAGEAAKKMVLSEKEWREKLTPEQYHVLREKGTERPFTGALVNNHDDGFYHCAACGAPLFKSDTKFESGSGWPLFRSDREGCSGVARGQCLRDAARGGDLREVRRTPGTRVSGWAGTDWAEVLYQLGVAGI
jgi:hypothetical protein